MTNLASNTPRTYQGGIHEDLPVKASTQIFEGSAAGIEVATGYLRNLLGSAADLFAGFASNAGDFDNSSGSDGDINAQVVKEGYIVLNVTGVVITSKDDIVYATDGNTFTLTVTAAVAIGRVAKWISDGVALVHFQANPLAVLNLDNNGGLVIPNGTQVTAVVNQIMIGAKDSSVASKSSLALTTEEVVAAGATTPDFSLAIWLNGTEYKLPLLAV